MLELFTKNSSQFMNLHGRLTLRDYAGTLTIMFLCACTHPGKGVANSEHISPGFVDAQEIIPDLILELRYASAHNFVGEPIDGYLSERLLMTREAALALANVQADLKEFGLGLKVFDAYRPQRSVDHFVRWANDPEDTRMKAEFYPEVDKANLFEEGYIAARSGHTRGSTMDVTLVTLNPSGEVMELDMGSPYDYFGPASWPSYRDISAPQRANRLLLRTLMIQHGFVPYEQEWWHFTLADEPFPDTYFDFPIQ